MSRAHDDIIVFSRHALLIMYVGIPERQKVKKQEG